MPHARWDMIGAGCAGGRPDRPASDGSLLRQGRHDVTRRRPLRARAEGTATAWIRPGPPGSGSSSLSPDSDNRSDAAGQRGGSGRELVASGLVLAPAATAHLLVQGCALLLAQDSKVVGALDERLHGHTPLTLERQEFSEADDPELGSNQVRGHEELRGEGARLVLDILVLVVGVQDQVPQLVGDGQALAVGGGLGIQQDDRVVAWPTPTCRRCVECREESLAQSM